MIAECNVQCAIGTKNPETTVKLHCTPQGLVQPEEGPTNRSFPTPQMGPSRTRKPQKQTEIMALASVVFLPLLGVGKLVDILAVSVAVDGFVSCCFW